MGHEIIWKLKDAIDFKRRLQLLYAEKPGGQKAQDFIIKKFTDDLAQYPYQWPIQDEAARIEEWKWGPMVVRYNRDPANHLVEILEIQEMAKQPTSDERKRRT